MTKLSLLIAVPLALGLHVSAAHAQLSRTYVSAAIGDDTKDCNRLTPCRTFQTAHDKTNSDGEVMVLDPGGYGGLTITKSISIVNDSAGEASILVSGGATGITIHAPAAGYVNLRGITVQGIGFGGGFGVTFNSGFSLTMTNCVVRNLTQTAISFFSPAGGNLAISNTLVADNGGDGILVGLTTAGGTAKVSLSRVALYNNSKSGLNAFGTTGSAPHAIKITVADSVAAGNGEVGFATNFGDLLLIRSAASGSPQGISAQGPGNILRVSQSTLTGNGQGWVQAAAGTILSYGDNYINGNADGDPAIPTVSVKK